MRLRQMRNDYDKWLKKSKTLKKWVVNEFNSDKKHDLMATAILNCVQESPAEQEWLKEFEDSLAVHE